MTTGPTHTEAIVMPINNPTNEMDKLMVVSLDKNVVIFTVSNAPLYRTRTFNNANDAAVFARTIILKRYRVIRIESLNALHSEALDMEANNPHYLNNQGILPFTLTPNVFA